MSLPTTNRTVLCRNTVGGIFTQTSENSVNIDTNSDMYIGETFIASGQAWPIGAQGNITCNTLNYQTLNPPCSGAQGPTGAQGEQGPSGGGPGTGEILATTVWTLGNTVGNTSGSWPMNDQSFEQVKFTDAQSAPQEVKITFAIPSSGYIRIVANMYIQTAATPNFAYLGLNNNLNSGGEGSNLKYGWINPGLNNDFQDQVAQVEPIWDIPIEILVDSAGTKLKSGESCTIYLQGYASRSGMQILFQSKLQNIGQNVGTNTTPYGGPLTLTAYHINESLWQANPPDI